MTKENKSGEMTVVYDQGEGNDKAIVAAINDRLNMELADPKTVSALIATTFNGMDAVRVKQAMMEGMIRGFKFEDFLHKNVYAIPYGSGYSLVTSIDHARKIGQRSGVIGVGAPVYTFKDEEKKQLDTCSVTVKKLVSGHIGEFVAEVSFDEYTTGRNLWSSKPKTMIAKVAEMHALRKACPEVAEMYTEEEMHKEVQQPNRMKKAGVDTKSISMGNLELHGDQEESGNGEGETEIGSSTESNEEQE